HRSGNAMLLALLGESANLLRQLLDRLVGDRLVIAGVVADLETVLVKLGDLLPTHVVAFVRLEVEPLGDEESRREAVLLQHWASDGVMRLAGVVERQHDETVRDRLEDAWRGGPEEGEQKQRRDERTHDTVPHSRISVWRRAGEGEARHTEVACQGDKG